MPARLLRFTVPVTPRPLPATVTLTPHHWSPERRYVLMHAED